MNIKLSNIEKEELIKKLENDDYIDDKYKDILFKGKKEYELIYDGKEREVDILSDTMAVPLQKVKSFNNGKDENDWHNMLIFGDNLQVLKTLLDMKEKGKLKNADGTDGIRLICIDPPFSTKQDFKGSQDQKAYQDKIAGAKFLEYLRKRLVFIRELLSDDGSIYVHLDYKKCHYVKLLMDEIFGGNNFLNEIIWQRTTNTGSSKALAKKFSADTDNILYYSKTNDYIFNKLFREYGKDYLSRFKYEDDLGKYRWSAMKTYSDKKYEEQNNKGMIRWGKNAQYPEIKQYIEDLKGVPMNNLWNDIFHVNPMALDNTGYPTQKPEELIQRIVSASTNPGDLVLDCFEGSGTTLAVAEKLNRRWIGIDCGKLAIYTTQKRLLSISKSKDLENDKKKYGKDCKPFALYNAGLYDYKKIKEMPWEQYRDFALKLFQCRDEQHTKYKVDFDGYLGSDSVIVFNYQKHKEAVMDRGYIEDLHQFIGDKIGQKLFIIAPAASVKFLEDYIQKGKIKYYILRIPYSIIEEIHKKDFKKLSQPMSEADVNDTIDSVGFDFVQTPKIECKYSLEKLKEKNLFNQKKKECVIKIKTFRSKVLSKKPIVMKNLESLSMVMLDYDFNGEVFDLDDVFYANEIESNNYEIRLDSDKIKEQMMIIYLDIYGNEKREIKTLKEFRR